MRVYILDFILHLHLKFVVWGNEAEGEGSGGAVVGLPPEHLKRLFFFILTFCDFHVKICCKPVPNSFDSVFDQKSQNPVSQSLAPKRLTFSSTSFSSSSSKSMATFSKSAQLCPNGILTNLVSFSSCFFCSSFFVIIFCSLLIVRIVFDWIPFDLMLPSSQSVAGRSKLKNKLYSCKCSCAKKKSL